MLGKIFQDKKNVFKWISILTAVFFCFCTMLYSDNLINSSVGYEYISSVFSGDFFDFYNKMDWSYGLTIYTIYAVWSIPVWILNHILGITDNMNAIPVLLWYKSLLAMFAVWSFYLVCRIAECFTSEKREEIGLQYASSVLFIFPIFAIAQCDIIGLCFVLLGVLAYIKEEDRKFIIFFAIAVTMKYFALFVFIPLVLYRYRRLGKLVSVMAAGIVLVVISMILIKHSSGGSAAIADDSYYVNRHIQAFNDVSLELTSWIEIGMFPFFYVLLCVVAYIAPDNDKEKRVHYSLWLSFAGYMCFFLYYVCNIYWFVLLAPFLILISYSTPSMRKVNLILETVFSTTVFLKYIYLQDWVFMGKKTFSRLLLRTWGIAPEENLVQMVLGPIMGNLGDYLPIIQGVTYASAGLLLVLNFPAFRIKNNESEEDIEQDVKMITWLRIAIVYIWIFLGIWGLIRAQESYWFNGSALFRSTPNGVDTFGCKYTGDLFHDQDGVWMGEELNIHLNLKREIDSDLKLVTHGYGVSNETTVFVYIGPELVGNLQREDEGINITDRFMIIPEEKLTGEKRSLTITLKTMPEKYITDSEGENIPLGLYIENIRIEQVHSSGQ